MPITRQADYAVRAVLHLARLGPEATAPTAHIAAEQKISPTFLAKIISQLAAAGVVRATRGAHGGVRLARPADSISLLEIVEAIDGPLVFNACVCAPLACPLGAGCVVQAVWCEAQNELTTRLGRTTFGQLAEAEIPSPNS